MQLQSMHLVRLQGRSLQGLSDDALLGGAIGGSQAAAPPILVHCSGMHESQHWWGIACTVQCVWEGG